jgi:hypothetical protein
MRTILVFLCILSVTFSAKAQLFGKDWAEGNYYDSTGRKTTGLIAWSAPDKLSKKPGDHIFYKPTSAAEKVRIETSDITSFTMGSDSFVVSHISSINYAPVLRVLINRPIKLYYWSAHVTSIPVAALGALGGALAGATVISGTSGGKAYLYGPDANNLTVVTRKNFIDAMCSIMSNRPEVTMQIINKTLRFADIDDLLILYRTGKMPQKKSDDIY